MFKLVLLAALVGLGVVFMPDDFMARIEQGVGSTGNYLQGEVSKRAPGLTLEFNRKVADTKRDAQIQYERLKENYLPAVGAWVLSFFAPKAK